MLQVNLEKGPKSHTKLGSFSSSLLLCSLDRHESFSVVLRLLVVLSRFVLELEHGPVLAIVGDRLLVLAAEIIKLTVEPTVGCTMTNALAYGARVLFHVFCLFFERTAGIRLKRTFIVQLVHDPFLSVDHLLQEALDSFRRLGLVDHEPPLFPGRLQSHIVERLKILNLLAVSLNQLLVLFAFLKSMLLRFGELLPQLLDPVILVLELTAAHNLVSFGISFGTIL